MFFHNHLYCHELHGFSDASEMAYAVVVYIRTVYDDGKTIITSVITSKNHVALLKKQTIPHLELSGARILARLLQSVKSELEPIITLSGCYHWVDSFTTLCWIKNEHHWKQYVQHRVDEIRRISDKNTWKFCPGSDNPADIHLAQWMPQPCQQYALVEWSSIFIELCR